MSRTPTPLHVLERRGSIKKNPQRYRERLQAAEFAPEIPPIGDAPAHWNVPEDSYNGLKYARWRAIWEEFAPCIQTGSPMRRALLEMFCEQMDRFRTSPSSMKLGDKSNLANLARLLGTEQGATGGSKKPEGYGGAWEAFG
jgi:hypothetical protein